MTMTVVSLNTLPDGDGPRRLRPAPGPVAIGLDGLPGGPDRPPPDDPAITPEDHQRSHALYAYPTLHHPVWQTIRGQARVAAPEAPLPPAAFDEHLALAGVQESQLWLGDLLRFPDCTLVVAGPRLPDAGFDASLGFPHAGKMVEQSRWSGFWLAVRAPGSLRAGDPFRIVPGPRATGLVELFRARLAKRNR
jgi:MOSC domain-containing protein YiiM